MDRINRYQQIVERVLTQYLELTYANADIHNKPIFKTMRRGSMSLCRAAGKVHDGFTVAWCT